MEVQDDNNIDHFSHLFISHTSGGIDFQVLEAEHKPDR
jgi:hypothetical protein